MSAPRFRLWCHQISIKTYANLGAVHKEKSWCWFDGKAFRQCWLSSWEAGSQDWGNPVAINYHAPNVIAVQEVSDRKGLHPVIK